MTRCVQIVFMRKLNRLAEPSLVFLTVHCTPPCRHQGDEEYDEDEEEGEEGATYEELIELGQQIGDVKAER